MRAKRAAVLVALGSLTSMLAACGGGDDDARSTVTAAATTGTSATPVTTASTLTVVPRSTTSTAAPTTSAAPTTIRRPTTTAPPATPAPTPAPPPPTAAPTIAVAPAALPVPIDPPPDDGSTEPVVELGTIEIPRLGLQRTISEGIRLPTLDRGPGHWPGTAMPGEAGNVVLAGHRVSHNEDFRDLDQLSPGDEVIMSSATGRHRYVVESTEIVPPDALWIVDQTPEPTATLFACHPPGSVSERIVVHLVLA